MNITDIILVARDLRTDGPENPEYDRALIEMVMDLSGKFPDDPDGRRAWAEREVLGGRPDHEAQRRCATCHEPVMTDDMGQIVDVTGSLWGDDSHLHEVTS